MRGPGRENRQTFLLLQAQLTGFEYERAAVRENVSEERAVFEMLKYNYKQGD